MLTPNCRPPRADIIRVIQVKRRSVEGSLFQRAVLATAVVMVLAFILLTVTPVEVSAPIRLAEAAILAVGIITLFVLNLLLLRHALTPLTRMAERMKEIDLRAPNQNLSAEMPPYSELLAFGQAFDEMVARLAEERRAGARAALLAQETERARIARSLHDEAGQTLTAVALQLERAAAEGPPEQRERLGALAFQLQDTLDEIRRIVRELRPEALEDLGLVNALIALTRRLDQQSEVRFTHDFAPDLPSLSPETELVLYRVAQEALTNVLRHSRARRCMVSLRPHDGGVRLVVSDDGVGFNPHAELDTTGLEGMRERAMLAGGALRIESEPGTGTTVTLEVPR